VTLGVKFWSSQSGTLSAIRFYRATVSAQRYVAKAGSRFPGINLIINPAGPGVSSDADTVLNVTIVATQ